MTQTKLRFAPSPTGYVHAGNIRTALVNWLYCQKHGGEFYLRFDDTDKERSKPEYVGAIEEDMAWLGLTYVSSFHQSDRFADYEKAKEKLVADGRLYACYETPQELDIQRKQLASRGLPPIYNRDALKLTDDQKAKYEAEGRKPHWRFLLKDAEIVWNDLIRGEMKMNATHMSDPVLIREDGVPLYTLASVVDDGDMNITHIVRGEDHVSNSAVQIQIFEALGHAVPTFAHMALLKTKDGELSKRLGTNNIRQLRESGILPMAVNSLLARIGTSDAIEAVDDMAQLVESFDFSKFSRAPANYDVEELKKLNEKLIHTLPYEAVKDQLPGIDEEFWLAVRANLTSIADAKDWWNMVHGTIDTSLPADDAEFVRQAAEQLPSGTYDESTYDAWMAAVKPTTDRKGKALFMPIRKALTGMDHGPELKKILPLLGRDRVLERLNPVIPAKAGIQS